MLLCNILSSNFEWFITSEQAVTFLFRGKKGETYLLKFMGKKVDIWQF